MPSAEVEVFHNWEWMMIVGPAGDGEVGREFLTALAKLVGEVGGE